METMVIERNARNFFCKELTRLDAIKEHSAKEQQLTVQRFEQEWKIKWTVFKQKFFEFFLGRVDETELKKICLHKGENPWDFVKINTADFHCKKSSIDNSTDIDILFNDLEKIKIYSIIWSFTDILTHVDFHHKLINMAFEQCAPLYPESDPDDYQYLPFHYIYERGVVGSFYEPSYGKNYYNAIYKNKKNKDIFKSLSQRINKAHLSPDRLIGFYNEVLTKAGLDSVDVWMLKNSIDIEMQIALYKERISHKGQVDYEQEFLEVVYSCYVPAIRKQLIKIVYPFLKKYGSKKEDIERFLEKLKIVISSVNRDFRMISELLVMSIYDDLSQIEGGIALILEGERQRILNSITFELNAITDELLFAKIGREVISGLHKLVLDESVVERKYEYEEATQIMKIVKEIDVFEKYQSK